MMNTSISTNICKNVLTKSREGNDIKRTSVSKIELWTVKVQICILHNVINVMNVEVCFLRLELS